MVQLMSNLRPINTLQVKQSASDVCKSSASMSTVVNSPRPELHRLAKLKVQDARAEIKGGEGSLATFECSNHFEGFTTAKVRSARQDPGSVKFIYISFVPISKRTRASHAHLALSSTCHRGVRAPVYLPELSIMLAANLFG
ncbi:hypothetical protein EVAR_102971_1 [Eumeta japonica]|uniref:Uncharacterized protein n=1 Tax=Eumeta variegata TaxID=151549 RepID=A0A4C1UPN2_EUMVA|nr:hypothetical protein EVAR_102971_1 [Eumeta japonica]